MELGRLRILVRGRSQGQGPKVDGGRGLVTSKNRKGPRMAERCEPGRGN